MQFGMCDTLDLRKLKFTKAICEIYICEILICGLISISEFDAH